MAEWGFDTNSPGYQDFSFECPICKKAGKIKICDDNIDFYSHRKEEHADEGEQDGKATIKKGAEATKEAVKEE